MTSARANICLLLTAIIWGSGFIAQSSAMDHIGPLFFIGLRFAVATIAVLPLALREHSNAAKPLQKSDWNMFAFIGGILFLGMVFQQIGLVTTSVTNSGFLTGLYLIMVPILGIALYREWPHFIVWPCTVTALYGIFLLSGGKLDTLVLGDWYTVICAVFWALQIVLINRFASKTNRPISQAVMQFAVTAVLGLFGALMFETLDWSAVVLAAPEILFAGVFAGGIAFTLQSIGQRHTTAAKAAIILSSEALFAALFDALINGTRLSGLPLIGCAVIFAAMLTVELLPMWLQRRTAQLNLATSVNKPADD